jgi:hypothetical protein
MGRVDQVAATRKRTHKPPHKDFRARIALSAAPIVVRAAAERGMSVSAYIRRATLAFAAFDQGLDLSDILADEPATRLKSEAPGMEREDGGRGHGQWVIRGLK